MPSLLSPFGGRPPRGLGVRSGKLADCPSSPNCVCSDAGDPGHRVDPLELTAGAERAWSELAAVVAAQPRTRITERSADYLRAEAKSALLGFVDDVEFHLRPAEGIVAVRSASRLGYSDLGVNRRRIEGIRARLRARGVVR